MPTNKTQRLSQLPQPDPYEFIDSDSVLVLQRIDGTEKLCKATPADFYKYIKKTILDTDMMSHIHFGDGFLGGPNKPLEIDYEWFNSTAIPMNFIELSIIGDQRVVNLPIQPGGGFIIDVTKDIPVTLNRNHGVITAGGYEIKDQVKGDLAYKTVNIYCVNEGTGTYMRFILSLQELPETWQRTFIGRAFCDASGVKAIEAFKFSRLGLHRLSSDPKGTSIPYTLGNVDTVPDKWWNTRWNYK